MMHRSAWRIWTAITMFAVVLSAASTGCNKQPIPVTWTASGIQVTRLDMPLDRSGHTFMVGEYTLEGRESSGRGAREFRDRMLLTIHLRGFESHVLGYIARTYASGGTLALRFSGVIDRAGQNPKEMIVTGRVHMLGPGGLVTYATMSWVELRLDPASGRISAKGS